MSNGDIVVTIINKHSNTTTNNNNNHSIITVGDVLIIINFKIIEYNTKSNMLDAIKNMIMTLPRPIVLGFIMSY